MALWCQRTSEPNRKRTCREKAAMKKKKRDRKKERTERVGGQCFFFFKCVNTIRLVASVFECLQFGQQNRLLQNMLCIFAVLCITEPSHLDYCMFWSETCESQTDDAIIVMVNRARSVVVWRLPTLGVSCISCETNVRKNNTNTFFGQVQRF